VWIVRLALRRPYTFAVMALLLLLGGWQVLRRTPTDILPGMDLPAIKFLFLPMGMAVGFSVMASYLLSRTLVPTLIRYVVPADHGDGPVQRLSARFMRGFESFRGGCARLLEGALARPGWVLALAGAHAGLVRARLESGVASRLDVLRAEREGADNRARQAVAAARVPQLKAQLDAVLLQGGAEVRGAWAVLAERTSAEAEARASAKLDAEAAALAKRQFKEGVAGNLELVDAERAARDPEPSVAMARAALVAAKLDCLVVSGLMARE